MSWNIVVAPTAYVLKKKLRRGNLRLGRYTNQGESGVRGARSFIVTVNPGCALSGGLSRVRESAVPPV
ncbi:MAG TPA: hypothetical protein VJB59_02485 [Bdellovibrionota bacterium]|nr:hypothetical protein [Bdellovibrionota bacterium]